MAYLTSRIAASSVACDDLIHIVKTTDFSQGNPAGSSYKATVGQLLSGCCVNDFYVKNIHGCNTGDLFVQPLDEGNVYFGSNNASRGVTIDLPTYGGTDRVKVGFNTSTPSYTFDFYSSDAKSRFFWADSYVGQFASYTQTILSGDVQSFVSSQVLVEGGGGSPGRQVGMVIRGTGNTNTVAAETCSIGEAAIVASDRVVNLNIVKRPNNTEGVNTDNIQFFAGINVNTGADPHMVIVGRGGGTNPNIYSQGNVGISTLQPTQRLDVNGNMRVRSVGSSVSSSSLYITATGVLTTNASDSRLKDNVTTIENALDTILSLRGVNFTWKEDINNVNRIGFIAQEVESVKPDLVFTNENTEDKIKGVHYDMVPPILVEAVKELNQRTLFEEYTPTSINDPYGTKGQKTFDDNFMYIKTGAGWKKLPLMDI